MKTKTEKFRRPCLCLSARSSSICTFYFRSQEHWLPRFACQFARETEKKCSEVPALFVGVPLLIGVDAPIFLLVLFENWKSEKYKNWPKHPMCIGKQYLKKKLQRFVHSGRLIPATRARKRCFPRADKKKSPIFVVSRNLGVPQLFFTSQECL